MRLIDGILQRTRQLLAEDLYARHRAALNRDVADLLLGGFRGFSLGAGRLGLGQLARALEAGSRATRVEDGTEYDLSYLGGMDGSALRF